MSLKLKGEGKSLRDEDVMALAGASLGLFSTLYHCLMMCCCVKKNNNNKE
jgi:hypothetical protein